MITYLYFLTNLYYIIYIHKFYIFILGKVDYIIFIFKNYMIYILCLINIEIFYIIILI